MRIRFECKMYPNAVLSGVKFNDGFADVDSVEVDKMNELMATPFVSCLTNLAAGKSPAVNEDGVLPMETFRNRLIKGKKVDVIKMCEDLGITVGDPSQPAKYFIDKILAIKYPEEFKGGNVNDESGDKDTGEVAGR